MGRSLLLLSSRADSNGDVSAPDPNPLLAAQPALVVTRGFAASLMSPLFSERLVAHLAEYDGCPLRNRSFSEPHFDRLSALCKTSHYLGAIDAFFRLANAVEWAL